MEVAVASASAAYTAAGAAKSADWRKQLGASGAKLSRLMQSNPEFGLEALYRAAVGQRVEARSFEELDPAARVALAVFHGTWRVLAHDIEAEPQVPIRPERARHYEARPLERAPGLMDRKGVRARD